MRAGFGTEAVALHAVSGKETNDAWDDYAKETLLAHAQNVPPEKLRFLHYQSKRSLPWWKSHQGEGAVLLGKLALAVG